MHKSNTFLDILSSTKARNSLSTVFAVKSSYFLVESRAFHNLEVIGNASLVDVALLRDSLSCGLVVSSNHSDLNRGVFALGDSFRHFRSDNVLDSEDRIASESSFFYLSDVCSL